MILISLTATCSRWLLYVEEGHRRSRVGTTLFNRVPVPVVLGVKDTNTEARKFYSRLKPDSRAISKNGIYLGWSIGIDMLGWDVTDDPSLMMRMRRVMKSAHNVELKWWRQQHEA